MDRILALPSRALAPVMVGQDKRPPSVQAIKLPSQRPGRRKPCRLRSRRDGSSGRGRQRTRTSGPTRLGWPMVGFHRTPPTISILTSVTEGLYTDLLRIEGTFKSLNFTTLVIIITLSLTIHCILHMDDGMTKTQQRHNYPKSAHHHEIEGCSPRRIVRPLSESTSCLALAVMLDHYRLGKTLGFGSMGKVILATHKVTGEKVCLEIRCQRGSHTFPGCCQDCASILPSY